MKNSEIASLVSLAAVILTGSAMAAQDAPKYGGAATKIGNFSGAQFEAMKSGRLESAPSAIYSTNWTSDSNGASYTIANVGTSTTGTAPGQGGWYTYSSGGTSTSYKIINSSTLGRTGQGAYVTNSGSTSAYKFMYQDMSAQWAARNAGDNLLWAAWDQYASATASTSANMGGASLYSGNYQILGGMGMAYGSGISGYAQRSVFGLANYNSSGTIGNYFFDLSDGTAAAPTAQSGGYTKYATSFNQTTGEVNWFYSVDHGANYTGFFVMGAAAGADLLELDLEMSNFGATTNAAAAANYGDLAVYATPTPGALALVGLAGLVARRRRT